MGENIKLARLRRKLTTDQVCERSGIGRTTLWLIESGKGNVRVSSLVQILFVLGLVQDIEKLGADDILGRKLQDADILIHKRGPKARRA